MVPVRRHRLQGSRLAIFRNLTATLPLHRCHIAFSCELAPVYPVLLVTDGAAGSATTVRQVACDASFSESSPESPQPVSVSIAAVIANSKSRRATAAASVPDGFAQKRVFVPHCVSSGVDRHEADGLETVACAPKRRGSMILRP